MIQLWWLCRSSEGELARLPDSGATNDQACFVLAAFNVLEGALAEYTEERRRWFDGMGG